jgi:hypothetical protein
MLALGFFYFLLICEMAVLGLLLAGIIYQIKKIRNLFAITIDDQNSKHDVSEYDYPAVPGGAAVSTPSDESPPKLQKTSLPAAMKN